MMVPAILTKLAALALILQQPVKFETNVLMSMMTNATIMMPWVGVCRKQNDTKINTFGDIQIKMASKLKFMIKMLKDGILWRFSKATKFQNHKNKTSKTKRGNNKRQGCKKGTGCALP